VAFTAGNRAAVVEYQTQLQLIIRKISSNLECVQNCEDFVKVKKAAGFNMENATQAEILNELYGQAHLNDYSVAFAPIYS